MVLWFLSGSSKLYEAFQLVVSFVFWVCNTLTSLLFHLAHCLGLHCWTWWRIQLLRSHTETGWQIKGKTKVLTPTVCWSSSSVMRGISLECFGSACPFRGKSCSWKSLQCWNDHLYSLKELESCILLEVVSRTTAWIWWSRNDANRILCLLSCVHSGSDLQWNVDQGSQSMRYILWLQVTTGEMTTGDPKRAGDEINFTQLPGKRWNQLSMRVQETAD